MELIQGEYIDIRQYLHKKKECLPFDFALPFVGEGQTFREINRFLNESQKKAHFKNHYIGGAVIDVTEWCENPVNSYFTAFLYFLFDRELSSNQNKHVFISEKICSEELTNAIADIFGAVNTVDLGVKHEYKAPIGFVSYISQEDDKHV